MIIHNVSLCGNFCGCLPQGESQIGTDWTWDGQLTDCSRCWSIAKRLIEFMIREPIEFFLGQEWLTATQAAEEFKRLRELFFPNGLPV